MHTPSNQAPTIASGVLLASLMLPGLASLCVLMPNRAKAENAPEKTTVSANLGAYADGQPGWERVKVISPQVYVQAPIAADWAVEGSWVSDTISGATPRAHTQVSGASRMHDDRNAGDIKLTRYLARAAVSVSANYSDEHDYKSFGVGTDARWSSADNNTTFSAGIAASSDRIDNTYNGVNTAINQHKHTHEVMVGLTQVLTAADIVQFNLTRSGGHGYYNDPYKSFDERPNERNAWIGMSRWNHYVAPLDASIRSSYRYYSDTFGVHSHTFGIDWVQPMGQWTFTPGTRYYAQSAANFYLDPVLNAQGMYDATATIMRAASITGDKSFDQRLSAFGAITLSMKLGYAITPDTLCELKLATYRQAANLRIGGVGSPGLDSFHANFLQLGLTHRF
ncbi:MAG: hypothetical protein JWP34_1924 [Massilia sp.]|nr:hypothetical protein [Massilia sp.]